MRFLTSIAVAALAVAALSAPVLAADVVTPGAAPKPAATASAPAAVKSISRQAYLDQAAKRFDAMDANHDGILTSDERKAHNAKPAHERGASSTVAPVKPSTVKM